MTNLLGCNLGEALLELEKQGKTVHISHYYGKKREENANDERVVRVTEKDGVCELVVCEFVTQI